MAGCQDEEIVKNTGSLGKEFTLTASKGVMSRTYLGSDGKQTLWSEGDQIYVSNADGSVYGRLTLVAEDAGKSVGTFKGNLQSKNNADATDAESLVYAVYPYCQQQWNQDYTDWTPYWNIGTVSGGDKLNAPMVGQIEDGNVAFKNTCGILRLNLQNANNATGKSFTISAKSGDEDVKFLTKATVALDEDGVASLEYAAPENGGTISLGSAVGGFMYIPYYVDQDAEVYVDGIKVAGMEASKVTGVLKQSNVKTLAYSETTGGLIEPAEVAISQTNVSGTTLSLQVSSAAVEPDESTTQAAAYEFVNIPSITEALTDGSESAELSVSEVVVELPKIEETAAATNSVMSFEEIPQGVTVKIQEEASGTKSIENLTVILPSATTEEEAKEAIEINMPNTTVTVKTTDGNILYIKEMTAQTFDETLVLDSSVEITSLTIRKGSVQVFGKIGEIKRASDNTDEITKITIEVGGSVGKVTGDGFEVYDKNLPEPDVLEVAQKLYQSMYDAQQDPMVGERIAVYNWASAAGISGENSNFLAVGRYSDDYNSTYHNSYLSKWISDAGSAVTMAQNNAPDMQNKHTQNFNQNILSFARIWRAVMIAEYSDNFGPYPLAGLDGENPQYNSVKEVYYYILDELKAAVEGIVPDEYPTSEEAALDPMFGFNPEKWAKYGNSLRLRFAMRLSEVDNAKAKSEFQAVDKNMLITSMADIAKVQERNTWDPLAGIYSRSWNYISLPSAMYNILTGLGGVAVSEQRSDLAQYTKPMDYLGLQFADHYPSCTDNPTKGYWLDGIPENLDPRALRLYCLPNDEAADNFKDYGSKDYHDQYGMENDNGETMVTLNASHTWNYYPYGARNAWSSKFGKNMVSMAYPYVLPVLSRTYGGASEGERVWFGPWETHFLLAEAALYGWITGTTAEAAYEQGIRTSFENFGVSRFVDAYLQSEDYNRVGVSVKFSHTAEPSSFTADYVNGYTNEAGTVTYEYPVASKSLYTAGLNTPLAKIITQKYIAQAPYCTLEMWNDRRRLGLPWFDMPNNDSTFTGTDMANTWTPETYQSGQNINVYPQRLRYPANLKNLSGALNQLGGENTVLTPLWWAKQ